MIILVIVVSRASHLLLVSSTCKSTSTSVGSVTSFCLTKSSFTPKSFIHLSNKVPIIIGWYPYVSLPLVTHFSRIKLNSRWRSLSENFCKWEKNVQLFSYNTVPLSGEKTIHTRMSVHKTHITVLNGTLWYLFGNYKYCYPLNRLFIFCSSH